MTNLEIVVGTADGVRGVQITPDGSACIATGGLNGHAIRGIAVDPANPDRFYVGAGLRGYGLYVTNDAGRSFDTLGFEGRWVWDVAVDPIDSTRLLIGTEPPMLYESRDAGRTWRDFPGIDAVESRSRWTFFHPPFHAGHLHGIALTPERPERILVGVEHGGLLRSVDYGGSWTDTMPGADLHRIVIDPTDPDRIFAGAGNGLFISLDGGASWTPVDDLRGRYVHGIVFDRKHPERIFVYIDSGRCPLYRSDDGGSTWAPIGTGLPSSAPADPVRLDPANSDLVVYAGDNGDGSELYTSEDGGESWTSTGLELPKVWRVVTVER